MIDWLGTEYMSMALDRWAGGFAFVVGGEALLIMTAWLVDWQHCLRGVYVPSASTSFHTLFLLCSFLGKAEEGPLAFVRFGDGLPYKARKRLIEKMMDG